MVNFNLSEKPNSFYFLMIFSLTVYEEAYPNNAKVHYIKKIKNKKNNNNNESIYNSK